MARVDIQPAYGRFAAFDVAYTEQRSIASCVQFDRWTSARARAEWVLDCGPPHPYVSGQFYQRELPCLLAILDRVRPLPEILLIDGFVWLGAQRPGLGAHLWRALSQQCTVIGVAKSPRERAQAVEVRRGTSDRPLFVSAAGVSEEDAARAVTSMYGRFRSPDLLRRADALGRDFLRAYPDEV